MAITLFYLERIPDHGLSLRQIRVAIERAVVNCRVLRVAREEDEYGSLPFITAVLRPRKGAGAPEGWRCTGGRLRLRPSIKPRATAFDMEALRGALPDDGPKQKKRRVRFAD